MCLKGKNKDLAKCETNVTGIPTAARVKKQPKNLPGERRSELQ